MFLILCWHCVIRVISTIANVFFVILCLELKMDGRIDGLYPIGRKMRTPQGSGTILLENGMETLMTKVFFFFSSLEFWCFKVCRV